MRGKRADWSADDIAKARVFMERGCTQAMKLAKLMNKNYTGSFYAQMRLHCSDLLPEKRVYKSRNPYAVSRVPGHARNIVRHMTENTGDPAYFLIADLPQPYHPLHDNPRMKRILGGSP